MYLLNRFVRYNGKEWQVVSVFNNWVGLERGYGPFRSHVVVRIRDIATI